MHGIPAALALALAGIASAGCETLSSEGAGEVADDVAEFFGASRPARHVERLDRLHDTATFAHRPDLPPAYEACLEEIGILSRCEYASWRDASGAAFILARAATEDPASLHRGEAAAGLARLGEWFAESEEPPADGPTPEAEAAAALDGLRRTHAAAKGRGHDGAACEARYRRLAGFRIPLAADPAAEDLRRSLKNLRGILLGVLLESREDPGDAAAAAVDPALVNLGVQVVRTALAGTLLHDGDPRVRGEASDGLGRVGGAGIPALLATAYRRETDTGVRRRVVGAAGALAAKTGGTDRGEAVRILLAALDDDDRTARLRARGVLRELAGRDLGEKAGPWIEWWATAGAGP